MRENEFSRVGRVATVMLLVYLVIAAVVNVMRGNVSHPYAFNVVLFGFALFLIAKLSVIEKKWISFGSGLMSPGMANLYRIGYWLMAVGVLVTFT